MKDKLVLLVARPKDLGDSTLDFFVGESGDPQRSQPLEEIYEE